MFLKSVVNIKRVGEQLFFLGILKLTSVNKHMEAHKKQLPLLLGVIALLFFGCAEQPDKATQQLNEVLKKDKQIECDFLRSSNSKPQDRTASEYDKKCR